LEKRSVRDGLEHFAGGAVDALLDLADNELLPGEREQVELEADALAVLMFPPTPMTDQKPLSLVSLLCTAQGPRDGNGEGTVL
jgi:hypothetical protein